MLPPQENGNVFAIFKMFKLHVCGNNIESAD